MIEANIYLMEVYKRSNVGDPRTTLLLKGLQIVCRFRFLFLERQSDFHHINVKIKHDLDIASIASRILAELATLKSDTIEAKLDSPAAWLEYLNADELIRMSDIWNPLSLELTKACTDALSITASADMELQRNKLAEILERIGTSIRPDNELILRAMAGKLEQFVPWPMQSDAIPSG